MATPLNTSHKLIIRESPRLSGMVDTNHLINYAQINPVFVDSAIRMAFTSQRYVGDPLMELSFGANGGKGSPYILTGESDTWNWKQVINARPAVVLENLESTSTPGIDGSYFKLKLDQKWFSKGDILSSDMESLVRVSSQIDPYQESGGWVYTVQLVTDDPAAYYNTALLAPGCEYIAMHNMHPEQSSLQSEIKFDNIITLQDFLGDMMRWLHNVTGYVDDMVLNFDMWEVDPQTGKPIKIVDSKWINRAEIKFWKTIDMQKSNYLFYGRGASNLDGDSGYLTRSRYGVKYQIENWGHVETYSDFSEKLLAEYLLDIYIGRKKASERNIELLTGEFGFFKFDEAMKRSTNKVMIDSKTVLRGSDPMNLNYGYQIKQYMLINGGTVTLRLLPYLDANITNTMRNSTTGYPNQSANFYAMDFSGELEQNFKIVKRANSLKYGYLHGTSAPWAMNGQVMSTTEDAYTLVARDRCSPWIQDVSATGVLKFRPV
jgi:hypothetical protein